MLQSHSESGLSPHNYDSSFQTKAAKGIPLNGDFLCHNVYLQYLLFSKVLCWNRKILNYEKLPIVSITVFCNWLYIDVFSIERNWFCDNEKETSFKLRSGLLKQGNSKKKLVLHIVGGSSKHIYFVISKHMALVNIISLLNVYLYHWLIKSLSACI